jgi:hypothetical protein
VYELWNNVTMDDRTETWAFELSVALDLAVAFEHRPNNIPQRLLLLISSPLHALATVKKN